MIAGLDINYIVSDTESDSILFSDIGSRIQRRIVTENKPLRRTGNLSFRAVENASSEAETSSLALNQVLEVDY